MIALFCPTSSQPPTSSHLGVHLTYCFLSAWEDGRIYLQAPARVREADSRVHVLYKNLPSSQKRKKSWKNLMIHTFLAWVFQGAWEVA